MLFLCITYCIPLAIFVYYILGPFLILACVFAIKRGLRTRRPELRQAAFIVIFASLLKMCLFDVRMLAEQIKGTLCHGLKRFPGLECAVPAISPHEKTVLSFIALVFLAVSCVFLFQFYRVYMPDRKMKEYTPEQVRLRLWVNGTFYMVIVMALWVVAPWVGAIFQLEPGGIFTQITWKEIALVNMALILIDFWKVESVVWERKVTDTKSDKKRRTHMHNTWTSRDTLWMTVFLFLLTAGLSYVATDILSEPDPNEKPKASSTPSLRSIMNHVDVSNPYRDDGALGH